MRLRFINVVVGLLVVFGACARTLSTTEVRDRAEQADTIVFAHGPHLVKGASCLTCHKAAVAREGSAELERPRPHLPREAECKRCHTSPEQQACAYCHERPREAASYPPRDTELVFAHSTHVERANGLCIRCHVSTDRRATLSTFEPRGVPPMETCTGVCHSRDMDRMACSKCHTDLQRYGVAQLSSVSHTPGFVRTHGAEVRNDAATCGQCHEPTHCAECHQPSAGLPLEQLVPMKVARDLVHRADFFSRHGMEAQTLQGTCTRCHGIGFCDGCHRASGVGGSVGPESRHEPGWLDPSSPRGHAAVARRDIVQCAACHESDAEQLCVSCHRVGGPALSPHPPGFGRDMDPMSHGLCRSCHLGGP